MESLKQKKDTIRIKRIIPFSPDEIYGTFVDPATLATWWGPKGFTNTFETFEFQVGGSWKFVMHGPDGWNYPNESVFLSLEPWKKLVIEHISQPHFILSVSLIPAETGTQIVWDSKFEDPNLLAAIRHIAKPGAEENLDRLHMYLRGELSRE